MLPARNGRRRPQQPIGDGAAAGGCVTGKRGYASQAEAEDVLLAGRVSSALRPDATARREQRCYHCRRCGMWHLARQQKAAH